MEDRGMRTETRGTGKSAAALIAIAVLIVALIAVVAWAFTQDGFVDELVNVLILVVIAAVIVVIIAYIVYAFLAVAYYATKGEVVQTGVDHSIDDVAGVEGRTIDEDGNDLLSGDGER